MFGWNKTIQKEILPTIDVDCARCGTEMKVTRGEALVKRVFVCDGCRDIMVEKFFRRKREVKNRGQIDPYPEPVFA